MSANWSVHLAIVELDGTRATEYRYISKIAGDLTEAQAKTRRNYAYSYYKGVWEMLDHGKDYRLKDAGGRTFEIMLKEH